MIKLTDLPFPIHVSDAVPKDCILILGEPDPIVLAPGQTEATDEQIAESYRRTGKMIRLEVDKG